MVEQCFVAGVAQEIAVCVEPLLRRDEEIPRLGEIIADKGAGHTAHEIDRIAEAVLFRTLEQSGFQGTVFSEESGVVRYGDDPRLVVCDPYCNTTLTFRGFRESAVAVHEYRLDGAFVATAVADLQIPRVIWAEGVNGARVTSHGGGSGITRPAACAPTESVDKAFLVVSLLKQNRRAEFPEILFRRTGLLATIDGAIVAARIAVGEIDGFVDTVIGQPSYEALAYKIVESAGGVVTDEQGQRIDFDALASSLSRGQVARHKIVAAATGRLHEDILRLLA